MMWHIVYMEPPTDSDIKRGNSTAKYIMLQEKNIIM
ncbi:hypothetical protein BC624_101362 [Flavobacterium granuli]|uniref:Uncharacterized protein n=1 Tax=Flavobacterium granuli TaxID=280093 RepID=A0A1M5IQX6_9FLAO|nr:hypothetical protein BC624_101362 [Flavobacterium granuli]SHG30717.1 hypothetical protein SAMN05443373_101362 [Flavobacterium granuli]